jgi:5'-3' exonuclease
MAGEHICAYYPTYSILDEVLLSSSYKNVNIFLDLKNILQTLYMEHCIVNLVESTVRSGIIDTSILDSLISFLSFHKVYAAKRNININFYIFFETGQSFYHTNIYKKYKISRRVDNLYGLDREKRDLFFTILQKNFQLIEKVLSKVPNIKVIRMKNFEADFIPYLLITRNLLKYNDACNIVYSNDHDLMQCVNKNTFIFSKSAKSKKIIKKGEVMKSFLKMENNFHDDCLPVSMGIIGDPGDDVDSAIKGIGFKTLVKILDEFITTVGGIKLLYENVMNGSPIFSNSTKTGNKYIDDLITEESKSGAISRNLKLVSFEIISRHIDNPMSTEILEKRNHIYETLDSGDVVNLDNMARALEMSKIVVDMETFSNLYFNYRN